VGVAGGLISLLLLASWSLSLTRERAPSHGGGHAEPWRETNAWLEHERFLLRTLMDNVPEHLFQRPQAVRAQQSAHLRMLG